METGQTKETVNLDITDIAFEGKGVGKKDGFVYFIPRTAVGDTIEAEVTRRNKNFAEGSVKKIIKKSDDRIEPPCPHYDECGGCHYQHLAYPKQLETKRSQLASALTRIGGIKDPQVDDTIPSPKEFGWRNRSIFHVRGGKTGYIALDKQGLVDISRCPICVPLINETLAKIRELIPFGSWQDRGIKHIAIRVTKKPRSVSVIFAVEQSISHKLSGFVEKLSGEEPISIFETIAPQDSTEVFGRNAEGIHGEKVVTETIGEFTFELSPLSFFQVNLSQAERLMHILTVENLTSFSGKELLELYSGSGLFTIPLSRVAGNITAIEFSGYCHRDAVRNIESNQGNNCRLVNGKVREESARLAREGKRFDVALLDPPRQGADSALLENIARLGISEIFYVSCSPPTLARDIKLLAKFGYKLKKVTPIDMFPQTYHIESLSVLSKG